MSEPLIHLPVSGMKNKTFTNSSPHRDAYEGNFEQCPQHGIASIVRAPFDRPGVCESDDHEAALACPPASGEILALLRLSGQRPRYGFW